MTKKTELILKVTASFCVAAFIAGSATLCAKSVSEKKSVEEENNGVGGYELPAIPQYEMLDKISSGVIDVQNETSEEIKEQRKDIYALGEDEKKLIDGGLYYYSYRIKKGDMIGVIAEKYGVSQDTLISVNSIRATRTIQIGQNIKIPSLDGILYNVRTDGETVETIADKYDVSADAVANANRIAYNVKLKAGQSVFVPGAELDWLTRQEINGDLFKKPIHRSYRLTSYFGWRGSPFNGRRQFHDGMDMACPAGTPIYAAMDGYIIEKSYSKVFGNYVIVKHHSGYKTLYGHMSAFSKLAVGAYVNTNSVIGYVGSTGMSTGPHVHFTVIKNGKRVNPYNLWG